MKDTDITEIINVNNRLLLLLGISMAMIHKCFRSYPEAEKQEFNWLMDAINEVVYKNNPLPPFPDRGF